MIERPWFAPLMATLAGAAGWVLTYMADINYGLPTVAAFPLVVALGWRAW